jgi:hypothetical protein
LGGLKSVEMEAARIIRAAYLDVDLIIARSTLSREELKQFSSKSRKSLAKSGKRARPQASL